MSDTKDEIINRLRRIEGQVRGIQRMIDEEKACTDIITQVAAVRAAINRVGGLVLEKYSMNCIRDAVEGEDREKALAELAATMRSFMKFSD
ncbi:metal-sensitive transcriptional regulator [Oscillospiraceae bacterium WX1]